MKRTLQILSFAAVATVSGLASAQDDTSASAAASYATSVVESQAVIVRVPVGADGREQLDAVEMRLASAVGADEGVTALESAFTSGVAVLREAVLDENSDSSTSAGWRCGWNNYGGYAHGYGRQHNYYTYQPTYSYNQSRWTYVYGYSYQSRRSSYNRGWGQGNYYSPSSDYNYYYYEPGSHRYDGSQVSWDYRR